jgi:hypothetical protein
MNGNTESPTVMKVTGTNVTGSSVTGSAVVARTWYSQVRSAFAKPHVELMSDAHGSAMLSHPAQSVAALLGTIPSLRFVKPAGLGILADATHREAVATGETVIRQGEDGDDVFFVVDGSFEVLISHFGHTPDYIRAIQAGDAFGELSVLYDVPRTATVRCTAAGHILRIPGQTFLDALDTGS